MHETVIAVGHKPLLVQGPDRAEFTQISVVPQVELIKLYLSHPDDCIFPHHLIFILK